MGDKAQRVRPGDTLYLSDTNRTLIRWVDTVLLKKSFADARDISLYGTGFDDWEDCEQTLRNFYGSRLDREPFTVIYFEFPKIERSESSDENTEASATQG